MRRRVARIIGIVLLGAVGLLALLYAIAYIDLMFIEKPAPYDQAKLEPLLAEGRRIDEALRSAPREDFTAMVALAKDVNGFREKDGSKFFRMFPNAKERLTREQAQAIEAEYGATMRGFSDKLGAILADGLRIHYDYRDKPGPLTPIEEKNPEMIMGGFLIIQLSKWVEVETALGNTEQGITILERMLDYYNGIFQTCYEIFTPVYQFENTIPQTVFEILPALSAQQMQRLRTRLESLPPTRPMASKLFSYGLLRTTDLLEWPEYKAYIRQYAAELRQLYTQEKYSFLPFWLRFVYNGRMLAPLRDRLQWLQNRKHLSHAMDYLSAMRENPDADFPFDPVLGREIPDLFMRLSMFDEQRGSLTRIIDQAIARTTVGDAAPLEGDFPALFLIDNEERKESSYERGLLHYVIAGDYACIENTWGNYKCSLEDVKLAAP